jgi:hypothetical protein
MLDESRIRRLFTHIFGRLISLLPLGEGLGMRAQDVDRTLECLREMISLNERNAPGSPTSGV